MSKISDQTLVVTRKQSAVLENALKHWTASGKLDAQKAQELAREMEVAGFDWKKLAKYCMWVALICILISVGALLADKVLLQMLQYLFNGSAAVKTIVLSILAGAIYWVGFKRRSRSPEKVFTNEGVLCLAVLVTAGAIYQLGRAMDTGSGHFSLLLLFACFVYAAIGWYFRSNLVWLFSLISFGGWLGAETGYASGWGAYYLGMNYPLRFVFIGAALILISHFLQYQKFFAYFLRTTLTVGLLYFFIALWIMSIFGNYGDMTSWSEVKQYQLFYWAVFFGLAACAAIYHGVRKENGVTKGFGITFLFLNLYTRYFEYFWDLTHKAIFFAVLGGSFWYLASRIEKIWNLELVKGPKN